MLRAAHSFAWFTSSQLARRFTLSAGAGTIQTGPFGRLGGPAMRMSDDEDAYVQHVGVPTSGAVALILGDIRISAAPTATTPLIRVRTGTTVHVTLALTTDRKLQAYRGDLTTSLGSASTYVVPLDTHVNVGLKVTINDTTGAVVVKIWGAGDTSAQTVLNLTSQDTQNAANATWDRYDLGAACDGTTDWSNVVVCDGSGTANADFGAAPLAVNTLRPFGTATERDWDASTGGENVDMVKETTSDDDITTITSSTEGDTDLYPHEPLSDTSRTIRGVVVTATAKASADERLAILARKSGIDLQGASNEPASSYGLVDKVYEVSPGGAAWTAADLIATAFGVRHASPIIYTAALHRSEPTNAQGVSITPSGTAFAYSAWTQIIASTGEDWSLTGVSIEPAVASEYVFFQIGIGSAGNEVSIASGVFALHALSTTAFCTFRYPIPVDVVPLGSRVSIRFLKAGTSTTAWRWAVTYYRTSDLESWVPVSDVSPVVIDGGGLAHTPSATAWADSNSAIQAEALDQDYYLYGVEVQPPNLFANIQSEVDITTGPSYARALVTTARGYQMSVVAGIGGVGITPMWPPVGPMLQGSRVETVVRRGGSTNTSAWYARGLAYPASDAVRRVASAAPHRALRRGTSSLAISSAASWTSSSPLSVATNIPNPIAVVGLVARMHTTAGAFDLDLLVDGVTVTTFRGHAGSVSEGWDPYIPLIPARDVPAGADIAVVYRPAGHPTDLTFELIVVDNPTFSQRGFYRQESHPTNNTVSVTPSGTAWAKSAYVQVIASTSGDRYLTGFTLASGLSGVDVQVYLAVGGLGSETDVAYEKVYIPGTAGASRYFRLTVPVLVASGSRVSVAMSKNGTSTTAFTVALTTVLTAAEAA